MSDSEFEYFGTTSVSPLTVAFDIPWFRNPRDLEETGQFNITMYDKDGDTMYYWDTAGSPTIRMDTASSPQALHFSRKSQKNGEVTTYEFHV
jgi:hypothetical protein